MTEGDRTRVGRVTLPSRASPLSAGGGGRTEGETEPDRKRNPGSWQPPVSTACPPRFDSGDIRVSHSGPRPTHLARQDDKIRDPGKGSKPLKVCLSETNATPPPATLTSRLCAGGKAGTRGRRDGGAPTVTATPASVRLREVLQRQARPSFQPSDSELGRVGTSWQAALFKLNVCNYGIISQMYCSFPLTPRVC